MADLDVRIVKLEPMRVASARVFAESPEQEAWERLRAWACPRGYLADISKYPIFGFNNPGPTPDSSGYGYEFWIRVPSESESSGDIVIKDFPGGLYAVTRQHGYPNPAIWLQLWDWIVSSPQQHRPTHELEKPNKPPGAPEEMIFELNLPIMS